MGTTADVEVRAELGRSARTRLNRKGGRMIPHEFTIGPFQFQWDSDSHEMFINRGEEHVGTIEYVFMDTWQNFYEAANPYRGPG